jgi:hypothetical protein
VWGETSAFRQLAYFHAILILTRVFDICHLSITLALLLFLDVSVHIGELEYHCADLSIPGLRNMEVLFLPQVALAVTLTLT